MMGSSFSRVNLSLLMVLSTAWVMLMGSLQPARAHEVLPAIADMEARDGVLDFDIRLNIENFMAGIDLSATEDTDDAPETAAYDALRALPPAALSARFDAFWPEMAEKIIVEVDGARVPVTDPVITVGPVGDVALVRETRLAFSAPLPADAQTVVVGWDAAFGTLVLRQQGVDAPYDGYLQAGARSDAIDLTGGGAAGAWDTFFRYIPVGFDHIVPKGLDHILFVLGLFFLSTRMGPLITQVSLFTLAHTITLALAALGHVNIPGSIVEPLIAASITYVAVENIFMKRLSPWRPVVVFVFGLLHGLGFASVLAEFGVPDSSFVPALIGFNIGVEVGQLAVIAVMFITVWQAIRVDEGENEAQRGYVIYGVLIALSALMIAFDPPALASALDTPAWVFLAPMLGIFGLCLLSIARRDQLEAFRRIVSIPASVFIGCVGAYWFVERVVL